MKKELIESFVVFKRRKEDWKKDIDNSMKEENNLKSL